MKCKYCGAEMARGFLHNPDQPVQWIPKSRKPGLWRGGLAKGAVELGSGGFWRGYRADAWYCAACQAVIIPLNSDIK